MSELMSLMRPQSVAIIGASNTPGKIGNAVVENMKSSGFTGEIYPINPKDPEVCGLKAYPSILDVGKPVDVAVLCVPAKVSVPVAEECGKAGVKHMIVITAGFKEVGPEGRELENKLVEIARKYDMRIVGPNCLGVMDTHTPFNATFAKNMALEGSIAFISQSGALCLAILDWSLKTGLGFSQFVSFGNKSDLNEADFIEIAANDPNTKVICLYLEDIVDGPRFIEVAKEATKKKPVIILKSGVSAAGAKAASSHTGALAGSDTAYETAFRRAGVLRASTMTELFDLASAFTTQPIPKGKRVAVITNSGGPGIVASDAIELGGLEMAQFSQNTLEFLKETMPSMANIQNPIDVIGDAHYDRYENALNAALADPNVDAATVLLSPTAVIEVDKVAEAIVEARKKYPDKPITAAFTGGFAVEKGVNYLQEHGVPTYAFPEPGVHTLIGMAKYAELREAVQDQEEWVFDDVDSDKVQEIFDKVLADGRDLLLSPEAAQVAEAYKIPAAPSRLATTAEEAQKFAEEMGFPVVMKISSPDIMHKTDIGGVKVGLESAEEVKAAFESIMENSKKAAPQAKIYGIEIQKMMPKGDEIIIGMIKDPTFGPMVAFGSGGILVNLLQDASFRLAAGITKREIEEMITETKAYTILKGFRGAEPDDIPAIVETVARVAQLCRDFPQISELDINPVFAYPKGLSAIDIKIKLSK
ncbi:MAG: acetate--CoA ligase family protein [Bacillota bacterium]|jgi:acetyl coenzyme A synthetase (ADP forming)-like protein|nr:CoA-binding protein [Candidatus Fermentithermobacillaceae bacterium]HAF67181.1 acyl-CoA synthetase [Clostridiales bacterium UBA9857]HOA71183.1 acetate--CoA ligase family protein [Bacillota bacterium]HPT35162.1 acetate--CoA ligase family protein [Bacillota bacterium]HPZ85616.1 acetate--CoA ligase family protein [Bacillota bacterium]